MPGVCAGYVCEHVVGDGSEQVPGSRGIASCRGRGAEVFRKEDLWIQLVIRGKDGLLCDSIGQESVEVDVLVDLDLFAGTQQRCGHE